jgi:Short C-terminal domain
MPGLLRGVARTAVVAGTASAVGGRVHRRQQNKWARQDSVQYAEPAQQYAEPAPQYAPPPRTGTDTNTKLAQLRELAQLRDSGVLDEAEFELQKSQILNS